MKSFSHSSYVFFTIGLLFNITWAEIIFTQNFDHREVGTYTRSMLNEDWTPNWGQGLDEGRVHTIEGDEAQSGRGLKVTYPEGGVGPSQGGAQWLKSLPEFEELYASYYLMFPVGWDGRLGGKLPGLCGADCPTGCVSVSDSSGFSARYMFRQNRELVIYLYYLDKVHACGDDFPLSQPLNPGEWIHLVQRVKLNTVGERNGEIQIWMNGEEVLFLNDLRLRGTEEVKIDKFYFSTFYGGSSADWAPLKEESIYFDGFTIYTDPSDLTSIHLKPTPNKVESVVYGKQVQMPLADRPLIVKDVQGKQISSLEEKTATGVRLSGISSEGVYFVQGKWSDVETTILWVVK